MPEFLRIRKKKFNNLKGLYESKQLQYNIFYKSVKDIADEIKSKIQQFIDTENKLKNYLKSFAQPIRQNKKKPMVPLRPHEKIQAEEFLNEILTELENDSNRSEYKNELEEFLNEILNEISAQERQER
jgi:hypothetical protein